MNNTRAQHNDWLHTFRALETYTSGFSEPMQGKDAEWFLNGPLFVRWMINNAGQAKALVPRKHQSKVVPGIEYAKAFLHYQNEAVKNMRLNHDPFREILKQYENLQK